MLNAVNVEQQNVNSGANVLFTNTRYCSRRCTCNYGWLNHVEGSGLFTLTNRSNCPMTVEVEFNGNVSASTTGATALAVELNGEAIGGTEMDYTVVTANTFQNVGATTVVTVPSCGSLIVSIGNVGTTAAIVKDANIIIKRIS